MISGVALALLLHVSVVLLVLTGLYQATEAVVRRAPAVAAAAAGGIGVASLVVVVAFVTG